MKTISISCSNLTSVYSNGGTSSSNAIAIT